MPKTTRDDLHRVKLSGLGPLASLPPEAQFEIEKVSDGVSYQVPALHLGWDSPFLVPQEHLLVNANVKLGVNDWQLGWRMDNSTVTDQNWHWHLYVPPVHAGLHLRYVDLTYFTTAAEASNAAIIQFDWDQITGNGYTLNVASTNAQSRATVCEGSTAANVYRTKRVGFVASNGAHVGYEKGPQIWAGQVWRQADSASDTLSLDLMLASVRFGLYSSIHA